MLRVLVLQGRHPDTVPHYSQKNEIQCKIQRALRRKVSLLFCDGAVKDLKLSQKKSQIMCAFLYIRDVIMSKFSFTVIEKKRGHRLCSSFRVWCWIDRRCQCNALWEVPLLNEVCASAYWSLFDVVIFWLKVLWIVSPLLGNMRSKHLTRLNHIE